MSYLFFVAASLAAEPSGYQEPPADVAAILDAPRPPAVVLSPDHAWMILLDRPALPPISEVAAPVVRVAGLRIDPDTNGPARESPFTGVSVRRVGPATTPVAKVAVEGRVRGVDFHPDGRRFALTVMGADGIELWVSEVGDRPEARRLLPRLNAVFSSPCSWLPGDAGLICRVVPQDRAGVPVDGTTPAGPRVEESVAKKRPARTYPDLLQTAHDEALLDHYGSSEVVRIALDGTVTSVLGPALWMDATPSPDGAWLVATAAQRPYSHQVPLWSFPKKTEVVELATGRRVPVAELPVADEVPITFGSVRPGRRIVSWRADRPATLWWVEALDGGDAGKASEKRDALETWEAPFEGKVERLWESELRFAGVTWGDDALALVTESWYTTRRVRTWRIAPGSPGKGATIVWDRSSQDRYGDPGDPVLEPGPYGWSVLRRTKKGALLLSGAGVSKEGVYPFLDRFALDGATTRLWQAKDPYYESILAVLDDEGASFLTWRQSQTDVPNVWKHKGKSVTAVTAFADWAPAFAEVRKEVIRYERKDGLPLSATVYLPPGYDPKRDGPRPALFWVYPNEFKLRSDAGQVTAAENTFQRPGGPSHLFFLLHGWIVVDNPVLPIVAEGEALPNDTYVEQLQMGAEAAVEALAARGWADRERLVVGGHSYGAFTTANLLAHTDLFRAGIARSGAYNRTLTPFGFQGEERNFWEAQATYAGMAPFSVADRIDEPLLLVHGADDSNLGTWPIQSARMYEALKGLGATVRWVELPAEDHGYRARESVGHTVWEMYTWADRFAAPPAQAAQP